MASITGPVTQPPVDRTVVAGARHNEMYDVPEYVDAAVDRLATFYDTDL